MTKEELKYYVDNREGFIAEITEGISAMPPEELNNVNNMERDTEEDYAKIYEVYLKYCPEVLAKYHMNVEAFTTIVVMGNSDREAILGKERSHQLLRDVIDLYGEEADQLIGVNNYSFDVSSLDGILGGKEDEKYREYYTRLAMMQCQRQGTLQGLSEALLTIKPEILTPDFLEMVLSNAQNVYMAAIVDFINSAPVKAVNGNTMKLLLERTEDINHQELGDILSIIPAEMYDEDFAMQLLEKVDQSNLGIVFGNIPDTLKDQKMYEYAISKKEEIAYNLPAEKFEGMSEEEYQAWCENQILGTLHKESNLPNILGSLPEHLLTERVLQGFIERIPDGNSNAALDLLRSIPEERRSRTVYEECIQRSPDLVREIPEDSFEPELSQEEYDKWAEETILKAISESTELEGVAKWIPRSRYNESVWNALLDKATELGQEKQGIQRVPIQNRTIAMYERAIREIGPQQIKYLASIDRNLEDTGLSIKEEYESWLSGLTEPQKLEYKDWYEDTIIRYIQERKVAINLPHYYDINEEGNTIPKEAISVKIAQAYLEVNGVKGLENLPIPSEMTQYNAQQYEDIILHALGKLEPENGTKEHETKDQSVEDYDALSKVPAEYRTDKVVQEAIQKHPRYLNYANEELDNFEDLLRLAYQGKLKQQGREEFTGQEIELLRKFKKNNANLFATLNIDALSPQIIECVGKESLERIVRYPNVQTNIIGLAGNEDKLRVFGFALNELKGNNPFMEPLMESLGEAIGTKYNHETFMQIASQRLQQQDRALSDEERTIITYLASNPQEAIKIQEYGDIANFVSNQNSQLDAVMAKADSPLLAIKNAYLERMVGMDYTKALELVTTYGNDPEQLLAQYTAKEPESFQEKSEKEALEIILKLKSLIQEKDGDKIREEYAKAVAMEDPSKSYTRYRQSFLVENSLKRAYGREITQALSNHQNENNSETVERTAEGKEYVVRKLKGPFNRMISVMDAYRKNQTDGNMYDKWNTNAMAANHALCYSQINESNPGTALIYSEGSVKEGIMISIEGFAPEALVAAAAYDLNSDSRMNTTRTGRQQRCYTSKNMPNQTRSRYSEYDIELQDMSEGVQGYQKIQPASIVCFETVDEASIQAAIDLSERLGRTVPIELIDRRELAQTQHEEIEELFEQFRTGETLQPELVEQMITKFNNVRNAHMDSSLRDEILGEYPQKENLAAPFHKAHLNELLTQCIAVANQRIKSGNVQEGLETIAQIKEYIHAEREKQILMPSMYEKQFMTGIDITIDQQLDRIQRENGVVKTNPNKGVESLQVVTMVGEAKNATYREVHGGNQELENQTSFEEVKQNIDFDAIQKAMEEVKEQGYYSGNTIYSEEHIARVMMFSCAIANMEGLDEQQQQMLLEITKYYASGRQLDMMEQHEQYSAEIAGKELSDIYQEGDISVIQAVIELQNFRPQQNSNAKKQEERNAKLEEICGKYGVSIQDRKQVGTLTRIVQDAVNLDKTRFVKKARYNSPDEEFDLDLLQTETAHKLVKFSYELQDRLASKHLQAMEKVAHIDFDSHDVREEMMQAFFSISSKISENQTRSERIVSSPIVREMFLRYKFSEMDFPETLGLDLSNRVAERTEGNPQERASGTNAESLMRTYQEANITQADIRNAHEQFRMTKNELEHPQGIMALSEETRE